MTVPKGSLMQRAGYRTEQLELLRPHITEFKFYVAHGIKDPMYDERWRLFYPSGLAEPAWRDRSSGYADRERFSSSHSQRVNF